ncbi:YeiH family putative sulfate export transporter [Streptococcus cuniculipharyngis]|uniref:YeiH family putative sulfate export transporter n=1 Tax=Streptococcus cuniculipharyngis TaxID=1562651 RepID=A0A5C5SH76_9STRE|nr:YeiH family protein [Streptococcus cuniculipharyngis]TWS99281.1 YeiH family putative sulfate export transporter [Streptococcus cuniculipharyngis]
MAAIRNGLVLCLILGSLALVLGQLFPLVGPNLLAIGLGMLLPKTISTTPAYQEGLTYSSKTLLQYAVILLGFSLSITEVSQLGLASLPLTLLTISLAFFTALFFGRRLGLSGNLSSLIGFGTAICGGSAILAAAPVLEADSDDIALSLSTIFCFNSLAILIFPLVGHWLQLSDEAFGLWTGTAVNDTSSVVAVGYSYSQEAGDYATIVKLARSLMIVPICLVFGLVKSYQARKQANLSSVIQGFPWFILYFLLASLVRSLGWFPLLILPYTKALSKLFMAMALVGLGSKLSFDQFKQAGPAPFLTGLLSWIAVALASLLLQQVLF